MRSSRIVKKWILCMLWIGAGGVLQAQTQLSLKETYALVRANYPALKSIDIYKALEEKENSLIDESRKPTVMLMGDASLQSEAISIGDETSPINVDVPIYRAQAYGEITYNLLDGGVSAVGKQINEINTIIQSQQLEVDIYPLKEQVNQIFSSVHLANQIKEMYALTEQDIQTRRTQLKASVENGVKLESELTKLDVRLLELENERVQVDADIRVAYALLSVLMGEEVRTSVVLALPEELNTVFLNEVNRPELKLFEDRKLALEAQKSLIEANDKPNISLFGQAGIAYPNNLNFSDVSLSPFALGGIRASYKLFNKTNNRLQNQKLDLETQLVEIQKETFTHNLNVQASRYADDFKLLTDQIGMYRKIAELQSEILSQLQVQLDEGVITATEYLLQSTEELRARQNVEITKAKLNQKKLEYLTIYGQSVP